jgi:uncharacterized membrane protein
MEKQDLGKTSMGMEANVAAFLAYLFGVISGILFYVLEKENKFVRFSAMQSILFSAALFLAVIVLMFIPVVGWVLIPIVQIAAFVVWIILLVKSFKGEKFSLPVIGDIAQKNS